MNWRALESRACAEARRFFAAQRAAFLAVAIGGCFCVAFAGGARADGAAAVPGDQKTFDQGTAAYDAGDYKTAFAIFSKLADDEDLAAMRNVALMERNGLGTDKDPDAALKLYKYVAHAGLPTAQYDLGMMLLNGEDGPPDPKAALPWLWRAAEADHPLAQFQLGQMYEKGDVLPQNYFQAKLLYAAAAARGDKRALERLSYLNGWPAPEAAETSPASQQQPQAASEAPATTPAK